MRWKLALPVLTSAAMLQVGTAWAVVCGDAYFNHDIDWPNTSPLYYSVAGAPANTCGDLYADRNGSGYQLNSAGWICTDSNGNATKGPWSSNPDDETAYAYIDWGTCTSPVRMHIWDVDPPTPDITTTTFPSSSFAGTATDDPWGAGFDDDWWASCLVQYWNETDDLFWTGPIHGYSDPWPYNIGTTLSGLPGMTISWSANSVPSSHQSGRCYVWKVQCWDGGQWGYDSVRFCV